MLSHIAPFYKAVPAPVLFSFHVIKPLKKLTHCHLVQYLKRDHIHTVAHQGANFKAEEKWVVAEEGSEKEGKLPRAPREHADEEIREEKGYGKRLLKKINHLLCHFVLVWS